MPNKVMVKCKCCGDPFMARVADRKRGWGRFCSKKCKAVKQTRRTGYAGPNRESAPGASIRIVDSELDAMEGSGWDAHKIWL